MIRYRNGAYEVVVNIGHDRDGKRLQVSRSLRMPERKRIPREVLDLEAQLRGRVRAGDFTTPHTTVGEALDAWYAHVEEDLSPTTRVGYKRSIRLYLKPHIGSLKLSSLTTERCDSLYRALRDHGGAEGAPLAPATVRQTHAVLRKALRQAEVWGWTNRNPAALATPPTVKRPPVDAPTIEQIEALIATADDDLAFLIRLAAGTGMRRAELCGLRWSDYDGESLLVARTVNDIAHRLVEKGPKSGKPRRVACGPNLTAALELRRKVQEDRAEIAGIRLEDGWILSDDLDAARPLHPNLASDRFRRHARRQHIPIRLHDLRHAKATHSLAAGIPPNDVAEQLGWSSTKMLFDTYGHAMPAGRRQMGAVLDL